MEMDVQGYALGKVDIQEDLKLVDPEDGRRSEKGKTGHEDHKGETVKEAFLPTEKWNGG